MDGARAWHARNGGFNVGKGRFQTGRIGVGRDGRNRGNRGIRLFNPLRQEESRRRVANDGRCRKPNGFGPRAVAVYRHFLAREDAIIGGLGCCRSARCGGDRLRASPLFQAYRALGRAKSVHCDVSDPGLRRRLGCTIFGRNSDLAYAFRRRDCFGRHGADIGLWRKTKQITHSIGSKAIIQGFFAISCDEPAIPHPNGKLLEHTPK